MKWNTGDSPIVEATIVPHTSNPTGVATTVTCTFTAPDGTATSVAMANYSGTWRCTGPTITQVGSWTYKVASTAGLIAAESGRFTTVD